MGNDALIIHQATAEHLIRQIADELFTLIKPYLSQSSEGDGGPKLLNRKDMAATLSMSVSTLDRLVSRGQIPYVKVGRTRKFSPEAVFSALARR